MEIIKANITDLNEYHNNPRKGNVDLIAQSLETYGQYKPITVNKSNNEILAGNHTFRAAKQLGWEQIDIVYVDVDDVTAAKIVAIDNRASDTGEYDNKALFDLLDKLPTLEGSGYNFDEYDDLKAMIQEADLPSLDSISTNMPVLKAGEAGQNNHKFAATLADYAERYMSKTTRMLMCDYQNDTYVWLIEAFMKYREANNIPSNAEAILRLLENAIGEKCPNEVI